MTRYLLVGAAFVPWGILYAVLQSRGIEDVVLTAAMLLGGVGTAALALKRVA